MKILKINLSNFRNFSEKTFGFSPKTTVIIGPNASGKTNIIEAIFLLSTGKSFRARIEEEMVNYEEEIARVKGAIVEEQEGEKAGTNLEVVLTKGTITLGGTPEKTERVARKKLMVNGVSKRLADFTGTYKSVLFGPWDMELVTDSPSIRRRFMDTVLSQVDREYSRAVLSYEKGLRQRNKLLFRIREMGASRSQLIFWDKLLIKNGDYISAKRAEFIEFANLRPSLDKHKFDLEYDKSAISEARLEQYKEEEVAAASTLVGPHRDDFIIRVKNLPAGKAGKESKRSLAGYAGKRVKEFRELARYGSRGEQRMGVLWLKLVELAFIENQSGIKPTLLLDDIFSELDHEHREIVMESTKGQQTIITTVDPHYIEKFEKVEKIELKG